MSQHTVFRQVCNQIPAPMISKISKLERKITINAWRFSATSHVFTLLYGYAAHALSLNDIYVFETVLDRGPSSSDP